MNIIQLWRRYDSFKAVVLLLLLTLFLLGYCVRRAVSYVRYLEQPVEYICTASDANAPTVPMLSDTPGVGSATAQKTAYLSDGQQRLPVTLVSPSYLFECYGLPEETRTIYMNESAFALWFWDAESPVPFRGTLDETPYTVAVVCVSELPDDEPFAVCAVMPSELRNADTLRVYVTDQDAFRPEVLGLTVRNPDAQLKAMYEEKLLLYSIRFCALAIALSLFACGAFFRLFRISKNHEESRS